MSYFDPETQAELNRQRIHEEMQAIHLQTKAVRGKNILHRGLALLGGWMVAHGEKLRMKNSAPQVYYTELNKKTAHR
jgi:hypothetical protein